MSFVTWDPPPQSLTLAPGQGHLWRFDIPSSQGGIAFEEVLSGEEKERARRFQFPKDRQEFAFCRGTLRILLGKYLKTPPEEIQFRYEENGKPSVDSLAFNLSHSKGKALLAIVGQGEVGVDLERIEANGSWEKIGMRNFSNSEVEFLQSFSKEKQAAIFYQIWTLKESLIKGMGKGLFQSLEDIQVSWDSPNGKTHLESSTQGLDFSSWKIYRLLLPPEYSGALAFKGEECQWQSFWWDPKE